jgi:DNA-binding CsgD family transcriptional regulator
VPRSLRDVEGQAPLVERESEVDRLQVTLRDAAQGRGSFLLVEGPAGIGKSRLLAAARGLSEGVGLRCLQARGGELERDFAYGVVRQLLERSVREASDATALLDGAARLAAPVIGLSEAGPAGPGQIGPGGDATFATAHGLYWLVSNLAAETPLLLEADDAHWADAASLRVLSYLAARIEGLPVALIVAVRPSEPDTDVPLLSALRAVPATALVTPAPLTAQGVGAVLQERYGVPPADEFARACHDATGGNPFLVSELVATLIDDGVQPTEDAAGAVQGLGPETVARAVLLRLSRLPEPCSRLANACAVLGAEAERRHAAATADLEDDTATEAADLLAAADILAPGASLRFAHPVVREAIYGELAPGERERLHARAASLLRASNADAGEIAPHLLAVQPGAGEDVVAILRDAAGAAMGKGAPDAAARYLSRALDEPPAATDLPAVLYELGCAELLSDDVPGAIEHLSRSVELTSEPELRAERVLRLARAMFSTGDVEGAFEVLERELGELKETDSEAVLRLRVEHGSVGLVHPPTAPRAVARLEDAAEITGDSPSELLQLCNLAAWRWLYGTATEAAGLAERALAGGRLVGFETSDSIPVYEAVWALIYADRIDLAMDALEAALADARRRGSVFGLFTACAVRAIALMRAGDVSGAEAEARTGAELGSIPFAHPPLYGQLCLALVERGELEEAEAAIEVSGCGPHLPEMVHFNPAFYARARLRMAQGHSEAALEDLEELAARDERLAMHNPSILSRAAAAEVRLALGDHDEAHRLATEQVELGRAWGAPTPVGVGLRALALVEGEDGVETARAAVEALDSSPARLERARALVDLGRLLRRAGSRREAREPLRAGLDLARACGATALVTQAHEELRVAGARPRRLQFSGVESLTASERRVADMASGGMSNREIAQALFVTVRTVENHLSRAYSKLDISSRKELAGALEAPAPA